MANLVLPKVRMFIPCLSVDLAPGKVRTIHGPLHTIRMPPGLVDNYLLEEIWFYVVLTDGIGTFRLRIEMRGDDDIALKRSAPVAVAFKAGMQLNTTELAIGMRMVPFPRAGLYAFRLVANHAYLDERGTALLRLLPE
jgi:hypothetical protein